MTPISIDWNSVLTTLVTTAIGSAIGGAVVAYRNFARMRRDIVIVRRMTFSVMKEVRSFRKRLHSVRDDANRILLKQASKIANLQQQNLMLLEWMRSSQAHPIPALDMQINRLERELSLAHEADQIAAAAVDSDDDDDDLTMADFVREMDEEFKEEDV